MPLHWQPVGPLPAATYWRRRAAVLLTFLAVGVVVALLLPEDGQDALRSADGAGEPSASPSPDPTAQPSTTPEPPQLCADDALEVQATADAAQYPPGAAAALTLTVRNTGAAPCRRALGQDAVELVVTSGEDRIWSSDDCEPGGPQGEVVLAPGEARTARASWPLVRSAPGCPPDQAAAQPGTYRVTARVGELQVPGAVFQLVG